MEPNNRDKKKKEQSNMEPTKQGQKGTIQYGTN